jgi:hypothetical protein
MVIHANPSSRTVPKMLDVDQSRIPFRGRVPACCIAAYKLMDRQAKGSLLVGEALAVVVLPRSPDNKVIILFGIGIVSRLPRLLVRYTRPLCVGLEGPHPAAKCILLCAVCLVVSKS